MFDLPPLPDTARYDGEARPVRIRHDVWIGQDVLLRDSISISAGAVIAAGSLVRRDVADYMILCGDPARVIRPRFAPEIATRFQRSAWWESAPEALSDLPFDDPLVFLDEFEAKPSPPKIPDERHIIWDWSGITPPEA